MKKLFGKLWLIWSVLVFVASWPLVWFVYQINYNGFGGEKKYARGFAITKVWGKWILFWLGIRVKVFGAKEIDTTKQYIYVSNHRSQIDIPINFVSSPELFVILSKKEAEKIPVVGTNLKHAHVTVNRKDAADRKLSIEKLSKHIEQGRSVLLYPEGRRNRSEEQLGEFKTGAFLLAVQHQIPIVPVTIIGSDKINRPSDPLAVYPGKVAIVYGSPIAVATHNKQTIPALIEQTKAAMLAHFRLVNEANS